MKIQQNQYGSVLVLFFMNYIYYSSPSGRQWHTLLFAIVNMSLLVDDHVVSVALGLHQFQKCPLYHRFCWLIVMCFILKYRRKTIAIAIAMAMAIIILSFIYNQNKNNAKYYNILYLLSLSMLLPPVILSLL